MMMMKWGLVSADIELTFVEKQSLKQKGRMVSLSVSLPSFSPTFVVIITTHKVYFVLVFVCVCVCVCVRA